VLDAFDASWRIPTTNAYAWAIAACRPVPSTTTDFFMCAWAAAAAVFAVCCTPYLVRTSPLNMPLRCHACTRTELVLSSATLNSVLLSSPTNAKFLSTDGCTGTTLADRYTPACHATATATPTASLVTPNLVWRITFSSRANHAACESMTRYHFCAHLAGAAGGGLSTFHRLSSTYARERHCHRPSPRHWPDVVL